MKYPILAAAFLLAAVVFHPGVLDAQESVDRLNEVVVTATKTKTPAKRVTRAVSTIPGEQLSVTTGAFLSDGLKDRSETLVRRTGIGLQTSVVVRGSGSAQVHVTMDGAHIGTPTTGAFDFNHITPDNLERVEILKGPGSVLYGSDAMGGVINLVTIRGEGPLSASYIQEVGMLNTFREVGSFKGAVGKWHLSGSASRIDSDGLSQNEDYQNTNLSTRIGYDFDDQTKLDVSLRHIFAIVGIDDFGFNPDPNRRDRQRDTIASAQFESPVIGWWSQVFKVSSHIGNLIDNDPSNGPNDADFNPNGLTKIDNERYGLEWLNRFSPVEWDTVTLGFEFEDREGDNRAFSKTQTTRSVYLHNEWRPTEALTLVNGVRVFRESAFGTEAVQEHSMAYFFDSLGLKIRGSYGEGFRVPNLNDLFGSGGNPRLAPEKSKAYEVGVEQVLWDDWVDWGSSVFRTDYEDLFKTVFSGGTFSRVNVGKARVDGVDLEVELHPWTPWTLSAILTHLEANERPKSNDEELLRIPKNTVSFGMAYKPSSKWNVQLDGLLLSSREEFDRNKIKGYLKWDLRAEYRFSDWMKGHIRVENLTDRKYSEVLGFPAPGTVATIGMTVER